MRRSRSRQTDDEREIKTLIDAFDAEQATKLEQELFKQRKRLADAERTLQTKTTKAALERQAHRGRQGRCGASASLPTYAAPN